MGEDNQEAVDSSQTSIEYKIGIIGPTRVGKTSLITALLTQGQELLAGTNVSMVAADKPTRKRINCYKDELNGSLLAGEFNPGAMSGTEEPTELKLVMKAGKSKLGLAILDYPGSWFSEEDRPPEKEPDWDTCKKWIAESIVLLVPIDAAVVMESSIRSELQAANTTLQVTSALNLAKDWIKGRIAKNEPGLLLFVPVKCETYFTYNSAKQDRSSDLLDRIKKMYQEIPIAIRQEVDNSKNKPAISIQYHPIDTIGCVAIKEARWIKEEDNTLSFQADYLVREPRRFSPKCADGLLISILRHITTVEKNKKRNPFKWIWRVFSGEASDLKQVTESLQKKEFGSRVTYL